MSKAGLIKSGAAFAKSLFKSLSKTAAKKPTQAVTTRTLTATEKAVIKSTEKELFDSTSKAAALKSAKNVHGTKIHMSREKIKDYDIEENLKSVYHFDKNSNLTCSQQVWYNYKGKPACLQTTSNPKELNPQSIYRLYDYDAKGQLQAIHTTTSLNQVGTELGLWY